MLILFFFSSNFLVICVTSYVNHTALKHAKGLFTLEGFCRKKNTTAISGEHNLTQG